MSSCLRVVTDKCEVTHFEVTQHMHLHVLVITNARCEVRQFIVKEKTACKFMCFKLSWIHVKSYFASCEITHFSYLFHFRCLEL